MAETKLDNLIPPQFDDYSLEPILDEYQARAEPSSSTDADERIRQIVLEALGDTLKKNHPPSTLGHRHDLEVPSGTPEIDTPPDAPVFEDAPGSIFADESPNDDEIDEDRDVSLEEEPFAEDTSADSEPRRPFVHRRTAELSDAQEQPFREKLRAPFVRYMATKAAQRAMRESEAAAWPEPEDESALPELPAKKASSFYVRQIKPMRIRCRVAVFLCLILMWISLGLPCFGQLGTSMAVKAGVSLILLLAVMMTSLDVVTAGLRQLLDLNPGQESTVVVAAFFCCLDAVMMMVSGAGEFPFCLLGALSLTISLWCERQYCVAEAISLKTASKSPSVLTAQTGIFQGGGGLIRSQRSAEGFVRRSEEQDFTRSVYNIASPILMLLSLILAVVASIGQFKYFLHILSALLCVSASFTTFLCFALPDMLVARRLRASGAALAGWSGCRDIGKTPRIIITDYDLFPPGTMKLTGINILEDVNVGKVVSYTASLLAAAESGLAAAFEDLMTRRNYDMIKVEDFKLHEGGGLSAYLHGEHVMVGSVGFMNLMGIRTPQGMDTRNAVCSVLFHELVGVFNVEYIAVESVRQALVTLLDGRTQPVFAIRDLIVTPSLVAHLFSLPAESIQFPSYRERYRITKTADDSGTSVSAVLARAGMVPVADAMEYGRKLWMTVIINTVLTLFGIALGLVLLFLLFHSGTFATAGVGRVLVYLLAWALPVVLISIWQSR